MLWDLIPIADFSCGCALKMCVVGNTRFLTANPSVQSWQSPLLPLILATPLLSVQPCPVWSRSSPRLSGDFGDVSQLSTQTSSLPGIFVKLRLSFSRIFFQECLSCRKIDHAYKALTKLGSSQLVSSWNEEGSNSQAPSLFLLAFQNTILGCCWVNLKIIFFFSVYEKW